MVDERDVMGISGCCVAADARAEQSHEAAQSVNVTTLESEQSEQRAGTHRTGPGQQASRQSSA